MVPYGFSTKHCSLYYYQYSEWGLTLLGHTICHCVKCLMCITIFNPERKLMRCACIIIVSSLQMRQPKFSKIKYISHSYTVSSGRARMKAHPTRLQATHSTRGIAPSKVLMDRKVQFTFVCISGGRVFTAHVPWPKSIIRFAAIVLRKLGAYLSDSCMVTMMVFIVSAGEKPAWNPLLGV